MQKRVTPVEPTASIPDPQRGDMLPPDGRVVSWNAYWAGLAARAEISAVEEPEAPASDDAPSAVQPPAEGGAEPAGGTTAGIPFMITQAMRVQLAALGKTDAEVAAMTPADAHALLAERPTEG